MKDRFNGDNEKLASAIEALLELDASGSLVPHGVGGHARTMLEAAAIRLSSSKPDAPMGWKLVPVELTQPMRDAFFADGGIERVDWLTKGYAAMLAASPAVPAQSGDDPKILLDKWEEIRAGFDLTGEPLAILHFARWLRGAAPSQTAVVLDDERAAFEQWCAKEGYSPKARVAWAAWQARAASPKPVAQPVEQTRALTDTQRNALEYAAAILENRGKTADFRAIQSLLTTARPASGERALAEALQFDAEHVSLKERADGKLVLTLLLDGVEGAPKYKVIPVNPCVVRTEQQKE